MFRGYENLFKKFLILNPSESSTSVEILRDPWINVGHKEEPDIELFPDYEDPLAELILSTGYTADEIQDSSLSQK